MPSKNRKLYDDNSLYFIEPYVEFLNHTDRVGETSGDNYWKWWFEDLGFDLDENNRSDFTSSSSSIMRLFQILKLISLMDLMVHACKWLYIMCIMFVQDFHSSYSISCITPVIFNSHANDCNNIFQILNWYDLDSEFDQKRDRKYFEGITCEYKRIQLYSNKNISLHNWKNSFEITVLPK